MMGWRVGWRLLAPLQAPPEVRQLHTFELSPGKPGEAIAVLRDQNRSKDVLVAPVSELAVR